MTTPHSYKPGASGMTQVCRPTPFVRFMHRSETSSKQLLYRLARADGWCARAFTRGSLPRNHRNTGELEVGKRTIDLFLHTSQNPERTAARQCGFHPLPQSRGLTPQLVSWLPNFAKTRTSWLTSERYHMCVCGVNAQSLTSGHTWGCRGRNPLPEPASYTFPS